MTPPLPRTFAAKNNIITEAQVHKIVYQLFMLKKNFGEQNQILPWLSYVLTIKPLRIAIFEFCYKLT